MIPATRFSIIFHQPFGFLATALQIKFLVTAEAPCCIEIFSRRRRCLWGCNRGVGLVRKFDARFCWNWQLREWLGVLVGLTALKAANVKTCADANFIDISDGSKHRKAFTYEFPFKGYGVFLSAEKCNFEYSCVHSKSSNVLSTRGLWEKLRFLMFPGKLRKL